MSVFVRLFKTYRCTFYGSQMWQINSQSIKSDCTSWNKGVRRILNLPHDAHTWLLGPLLKQNHINPIQHGIFLHSIAWEGAENNLLRYLEIYT